MSKIVTFLFLSAVLLSLSACTVEPARVQVTPPKTKIAVPGVIIEPSEKRGPKHCPPGHHMKGLC